MNVKRDKGFTIYEILVASFIFLIFLGIIAVTFSSLTRTYIQGNVKIRLQNTMRTSLDIMSAEIRECYDKATIIVSSPGPASGETISFNKRDERKNMPLKVEYAFDPDTGSIQRTDFNESTGDTLSTASIGENIRGLTFTFESSNNRVEIRISGADSNYPQIGTVELMTSVTLRSGAELLTVKSIGKKEITGESSLFNTPQNGLPCRY
jgi:type II secretory pathway pseudopilin PulG